MTPQLQSDSIVVEEKKKRLIRRKIRNMKLLVNQDILVINTVKTFVCPRTTKGMG